MKNPAFSGKTKGMNKATIADDLAAHGWAVREGFFSPVLVSGLLADLEKQKSAGQMKQAAIDAKPKPPRGGRFQREQAAAALSSSRSKPWMKKG